MNGKLTVIIPFLNEKEEVRNTVKSLRENSDEDFEIILINDCSTDGYDYKKVATDFNTQYIEHTQRMGVAASRDEGVDECNTEFFLFLDAHMRVYQRDWVKLLVRELKKDKKTLLCAATLSLDKDANKTTDKLGFGACLDFSDLSAQWLTSDNKIPEKNIIDIPCVLGASYSCNKQYWAHLEGLRGLKSYGLDEQFISIKVWLDGGRCRLIKNVTFGHIFRETTPIPYENRPKDFLKNILLITELFYSFEMKVKLLQQMRAIRGANFVSEVMGELVEDEEYSILDSKQRYTTRFPHTINHVIEINTPYLDILNNDKKRPS